MLEGVALNARWMQRYVEKFCGGRLDPIRFIGGGALSPLWSQTFADVLQREILAVADPVHANVRGAAFLAGIALGELTAEDVPQRVRRRRDIRPGSGERRAVRRPLRRVREDLQGNEADLRPPEPRDEEQHMSDDPLADLDRALKPYRGTLPTHARLPAEGVDREQVLADLELMADAERARWESGQVSGAVYDGEPDHVAFLNQAYALHSQSNPLHLDVWPSAAKLEAEIVAMTAGMLGADATGDDIVGTVTSGGTESIMLAMRAYARRGRAAGIEHARDGPARRPRTPRSTRPPTRSGSSSARSR